MTVTCASGAPRHEVALPRCAVSFPVTSLSAAETAARGDVVATVTAAAKAACTIAAPLGLNWTTCTTAGSSGAVVLPSPAWLLPPRPRPCPPPFLRSRPRRAPLRSPLSLETNACSGCLEDRCAPFFRGRLEWRVLTMRMISSRSRFFIACSVSARYGSLASPRRTSIIGPTPVGSPGLVSAGSDAALWWTGKFLAAVASPVPSS